MRQRIALRCEKTAQNYASFVALALGFILIKSVHTAWRGSGWGSDCSSFGAKHVLLVLVQHHERNSGGWKIPPTVQVLSDSRRSHHIRHQYASDFNSAHGARDVADIVKIGRLTVAHAFHLLMDLLHLDLDGRASRHCGLQAH